MYHAHFRGTHYEAGFRWGSLLLKHKNIILENIPFEITQERIDYALSCLPIYEKYYHEIMEEIQGLADGQQCDVRILQAVLFSMYSMPPSCNCSCFAFTTEHEILLGRNSDFLTEIERLNQNVVYKLTDGFYSFTGNTTAFVEIDGYCKQYNLAPGQQIVVDTGNLAAMDASCQMDIQRIKGVKNMFLGGEGLFNTVSTGPGRVFLQSHPISTVASAIRPFITTN